MDNRNIFLVDDQNNYTRHSVEELHSQKLNLWQGWGCSAGIRSLYIDFDGNVWRATCTEDGWIGNINAANGLTFSLKLTDQQWVVCTKKACACGADMAISKVKDINQVSEYFLKDGRANHQFLKRQVNTVDAQVVYSKETEKFKTIIWDLGRLCNFDCHYCAKNSHNNFDPVKNLKFFLNAYANIKTWNVSRETIKFTMTGGEPTVYKDYLPFVKLLKQDGHIVHTTTNGSNTVEYYRELAQYSDLAFSIHLEYVKRLGVDKFINNITAAAETTETAHDNDTAAKYNWVIARIMLDPGNLSIAKEVADRLQALKKYKNFVLTANLLHVADDNGKGKMLYNYSDEELAWIKEVHKG